MQREPNIIFLLWLHLREFPLVDWSFIGVKAEGKLTSEKSCHPPVQSIPL